MGISTKIAWCDSSVNPTTGCDGCELWTAGVRTCYAGNLHEKRLAVTLPALYAADFNEVRLAPGRMAKAAAWPDLTGKDRPGKPWLNGHPRHIFLGDLGDVLSAAVPFDYLGRELIGVALSAAGARHVWMLLTKQAGRLGEFADFVNRESGLRWPQNVLPGVSVTRQANVGRAVRAALGFQRHYFVSVEPMLEPVDLSAAFDRGLPRLVIVGGESGPGWRPMEHAWAIALRDQCRAAGVPFFFKQSAGPRPETGVELAGQVVREYPPRRRVGLPLFDD